ncbi:signal transduction histidine kinase [Mortierella sp. GBAus27b]|nr:hypothetical protein BGX31_001246 [Mortierella sp. GBA43]KAI8362066.1 signal transduction histidine kinase [Mortierella sp. GBAus27b]
MAARTEQPILHSEVKDRVETDPETENGDESEDEGDDIIDHKTFNQLLQMDDEEDREFSRNLVVDYFEQAEQTFEKLSEAMSRMDFADLTRLGHFLKGSSAAMGLVKVRGSCERLQHFGERKDAEGVATITDKEAEVLIQALLVQMQKECKEAQDYLTALYE